MKISSAAWRPLTIRGISGRRSLSTGLVYTHAKIASEKEIAELELERSKIVEEVNSRWGDVASQVSEIPILPAKKDLTLEVFGVLWLPYHLVTSGGKVVEIAAFT